MEGSILGLPENPSIVMPLTKEQAITEPSVHEACYRKSILVIRFPTFGSHGSH